VRLRADGNYETATDEPAVKRVDMFGGPATTGEADSRPPKRQAYERVDMFAQEGKQPVRFDLPEGGPADKRGHAGPRAVERVDMFASSPDEDSRANKYKTGIGTKMGAWFGLTPDPAIQRRASQRLASRGGSGGSDADGAARQGSEVSFDGARPGDRGSMKKNPLYQNSMRRGKDNHLKPSNAPDNKPSGRRYKRADVWGGAPGGEEEEDDTPFNYAGSKGEHDYAAMCATVKDTGQAMEAYMAFVREEGRYKRKHRGKTGGGGMTMGGGIRRRGSLAGMAAAQGGSLSGLSSGALTPGSIYSSSRYTENNNARCAGRKEVVVCGTGAGVIKPWCGWSRGSTRVHWA